MVLSKRWPALCGLLVVALLAMVVVHTGTRPADATHLCGDTGSSQGPFDLETYEAADWRVTYSQTPELAAFNQLFPGVAGFALPRLETGDRSAGSGQLIDPYIPPTLLKAIAWLESGWAQASYDPLVKYGEVGPVLVSHDCGYGIMQVTTGMQNVSGVPSLDQAMIGGHYAFNIARGARILAEKWNAAPEFRPIVGNRDPTIIENWYYAVWSYNGFAFQNHPLNTAYTIPRPAYTCDGSQSRSNYPYQELVFGCMANPPVIGGQALWSSREARLPSLSDPALNLANWNSCAGNFQCAAMDISTANPSHSDPTTPAVSRDQAIGVPTLSVSPASVALFASAPASITISNVGTGSLAWRASTSEPWLKASITQGVSLGTDIGPRASTVTISIDSSSLPPSVYSGQMTVESLYASGAPIKVPVGLISLQDGTLLSGKFNSDLNDDLVHLCCRDSGNVLLSQGDGGFTTTLFRPWSGYNLQSGQWLVGDFNGDLKDDLVHLCCRDFGNVWLSDGDGGFTATLFRPWSGYNLQAGQWLVGDFNGDSNDDLVHLCCGDFGNVWLSDGAGGFTATLFRPWSGYNLQSGRWLVGDFNGEGNDDLVHLCCENFGNVWLSDGVGGFTATLFRPWSGYSLQAGQWLVGNFDGGFNDDLVHLCCRDFGNVWLSEGDGGFTATLFRPWSGYSLQAGKWLLGDFNGDLKDDLAHLCCRDFGNVWLSEGDGGFTATLFRPWSGYSLQAGQWLVGDYKGDSNDDLAHLCCRDFGNIWLSDADGRFTVTVFKP